MYEYRAKVLSVYDGDTIKVSIDLGFGVTNNGNDGKGVKLRLHGINAPEMRGPEKVEGRKSRDFLRKQILGKDIIIKTIKDRTGKYGRYLAIIIYKGKNINDLLVDKGFAVKHDYGKH